LEIGILIIEFTKPEIFCGNNNPFIFRPVTDYYNRENETYNFLKRNVQFSLFFHPIKVKAFNHHLSGN